MCLSVCLSVTSRCCTKMAKHRITKITPHNSLRDLVYYAKDIDEIHPKRGRQMQVGYVKIAFFDWSRSLRLWLRQRCAGGRILNIARRFAKLLARVLLGPPVWLAVVTNGWVLTPPCSMHLDNEHEPLSPEQSIHSAKIKLIQIMCPFVSATMRRVFNLTLCPALFSSVNKWLRKTIESNVRRVWWLWW